MVQRSVGFAEELEVASVVVAVAVAYAEVYVDTVFEESECEILLAWCEVDRSGAKYSLCESRLAWVRNVLE